jgi:hypothetical protein
VGVVSAPVEPLTKLSFREIPPRQHLEGGEVAGLTCRTAGGHRSRW